MVAVPVSRPVVPLTVLVPVIFLMNRGRWSLVPFQ